MYPEYVYQTLARAREEGQWYAAQTDAAALCFDVLADFPDCQEAGNLVYELFCDEWVIYDNRVAIQQNIDEWDDRPWQQRRRLALSYRFMSRWDGKPENRGEPQDVRKILEDGKAELLSAYCLGDEECTDYAWSIFAGAIQKSKDPQAVLLWIGWQYADLGFFADAAEVLMELCSRDNNARARRLLAEVIWWRDYAHLIPWIPPAGNGSRYNRMMESIDRSAPKTKDYIIKTRNERQRKRIDEYHPSMDQGLAKLFDAALPSENIKPAATIVDWQFLDKDDGQPGELPDWAKRQVKRLEHLQDDDETSKEMIEHIIQMNRYTRNISPPSTPKRYDPNTPLFDPFDAGLDEGSNDSDDDDDHE